MKPSPTEKPGCGTTGCKNHGPPKLRLTRLQRALVAYLEWRDQHGPLLHLLWAVYIGAFCAVVIIWPTPRILACGIAAAVLGQLHLARLLRAVRDIPREVHVSMPQEVHVSTSGVTFHQNGGEDLARAMKEQLEQAIADSDPCPPPKQ